MEIATYIIVITLGLLFGSFTNVIIARLPLEESIIYPGSHCPHCNHQLGASELIPIISYLFQKGRCRNCKAKISLRYPLVELLCAVLFLGVFLQKGMTMATIAGWILVIILLGAAFIDIDHGIIPDRLTYPGMIIGLLLSFWTLGFLPALAGLLAFGGLLFAVAVISNGGMGGGDVKLAAVIGAFTGITASAVTLLMASLLGAIFGLGLMLIKKSGRKTPIKFGPFLALSAYTAFLWANDILNWYLGLF